MPSKKPTKSKSEERRRAVANLYLRRCFYALIVVLVTVFIVGATTIHNLKGSRPNQKQEVIASEDETPPEPNDTNQKNEVVAIRPIAFQDVISDWATKTPGEKGIYIYDLDLNQTIAEYESHDIYSTASLYKLFVAYEGYRQIENGELKGDAPAGTTGYTILKCLDLAIRESNSPCAETLWDLIGRKKLDETIETDFKINSSDISHLLSTPEDIGLMMKLFYHHPEIQNETIVAQIKDSFLNQPITEYDWRQGLPSGFSEKVKVYNKVGWEYDEDEKIWNLYHDAAILEFTTASGETRHFIVVVMTRKISFTKIRELATELEKAFYAQN